MPLEFQLACLLLATPSWWESAVFVHMLLRLQKALTYQPETCMPQINIADSPIVGLSVVLCSWLAACGCSHVKCRTRILCHQRCSACLSAGVGVTRSAAAESLKPVCGPSYNGKMPRYLRLPESRSQTTEPQIMPELDR